MSGFYFENEEWTTEPIQYPEKMFVITEDYTIRINNENKTSLITYGNPYRTKTNEYYTYTWPGCDKDENECLFSIIKAKGCNRMLYIIFLENEITEYIVDP